MDASIMSGDETQATQIINAVLPQPPLDPPANPEPLFRAQAAQDEPSRLEFSSSSSQNGGNTQYHVFGLASTQTDSQIDGAGVGAGSQKENMHASGDVSDKSTSNSSVQSHSDPSKRTAKIPAQDQEGPVPADSAPRSKTSKKPQKPPARPAVQDNAGPFRTGPTRDSARLRRRRSPSPASQDSFAGPLPPEEAEKLFVANTTTFNIPLSELTKLNADNVATLQTPSSTRTSAFSFSGIERRVPVPAPPRPLNHTGEILVAETPSNSSRSSNSQNLANQTRSPFVPESPSIVRHMQAGDTQLLDESQPHAQPRDFLFGLADQASHGVATQPASPVDEGSTEPSSSYERVLEADPYAPNTQPLIPTQPATQNTESTQPVDSTQDVGPSVVGATGITNDFSSYDPYNDLDRQYPVKATGHSHATSTTTTPRIVGRGLAGLIPQHRLWQYRMEDAGPSNMLAPPVPSVRPATAPQPHRVRDTQPSDTNAVHGSAATDAQPVQQAQRRRAASRAAPLEVDVVPDSEPMDVDGMGTDRGSPENSPAKRVSKRVSQLRLDSPVEEVVDSTVKHDVDGEDEEDEVPLAAASNKGKKKAPRSTASRMRSPTRRPQGRPAPLEPQSSEIPLAKITALQAKPRAARDTSAAPSSKASEDTTSTAAVRAARGKRNGVNAASKGRVLKSRSATPAVALKRRRSSSSDEETVSKATESVIPTTIGDGDTEPADDDYMHIDDEEEAPRSKGRSVKRKRVNSVASKSTTSRATARSTKASGTPLGSAAKKRKVSSSALVENDSATRVFALWRQDNHYYPGTVYSMSSPTRFKIHFDDGTIDDVDLTKMRLCKLMEGDQVIVPQKQKAIVVDVSRFESADMVTVEIDNGEELDQVDVEVADIRIASRTLNSAWTNRTLAAEDVCPVVRPLKDSPSPSKRTLGSAASMRTGVLHLRKTGFVVTMSPKQDTSGKTRDKVLAAIKAAGAVIIDDWTDIFSMDGTFSRDSKRWTAKYEDIKCIVRSKNVEQVFLLSDDHNAKPKYLMALALGIPCLDYNWVLDSASSGKEEDWQQYLLPAGLCESLDARVSQLVDLDWGNSSEHLREITGNKVPSKVFAGMRILCVSPDYVPVPKARRNHADDGAKDSSRMVPRIILAMGASVVEAVPDFKAMSPKLLSEYDYVVVKERVDVSRIPPNIKCVPFAWAKDCLISGRLLPYPDD